MSSLLSTLADLVRINSINPAYQDGRPESEIDVYIADFFRTRGIATRLQEVLPERPNLIAVLPGRQSSRRVVFEAHVDTASITGMTIPPFEPTIEGGLLYGRGACDNKAGLAGMMHALASLKADGITPPCEIWLAAAADEEYAFQGVTKLCEGLVADAAVVSEPTEMRAVIASKGCLRWKINSHGRAAHSSKPHLGINAIAHMAEAIRAIEHDPALRNAQPHPLVGRPTANVGVITGGVQVNFVPDECTIQVDRRLIPGESIRDVLADYRRLLDQLERDNPQMRFTMEEPMLEDEPLETAPDSPPALLSSKILGDLGLNPDLAGVPYGSDASKLSRSGIPSILFGPGSIDQAHAAVEFVDCSQVEQAYAFYRRFMIEFE